MNEIPHPGFNKPEEYETFTTTNGLEEAAEKHLDTMFGRGKHQPFYKDLFIAGAKWQEEQFEKNRLAACGNQTKEEYDRETDFAIEIINKEHRQPTFSDAINYGMRLQKEQDMGEWLKDRDGCFWDGVEEGKKAMREQMMKDAVEGEILLTPYPTICLDDCKDYDFKGNQKVRIIIVKEDEK